MSSGNLHTTLGLFFSIISNNKLKEVCYSILRKLELEFFTGSEIKDFYSPTPEDLKPIYFKDFINLNKIDLKGFSIKEVQKELEGEVIRVSSKFPTPYTTSYGLLRTSIHFNKEGNLYFGKDVWNYTAGDPNLWPRLQGGF